MRQLTGGIQIFTLCDQHFITFRGILPYPLCLNFDHLHLHKALRMGDQRGPRATPRGEARVAPQARGKARVTSTPRTYGTIVNTVEGSYNTNYTTTQGSYNTQNHHYYAGPVEGLLVLLPTNSC